MTCAAVATKMSIAELARDLIKIPSPSGEEKTIGEYLARRLEKNFKITLQKVGNRFNLLATRGNPKLILTTHLDTVPKVLEVKEDADYLYGRGACDTKGCMAAMVCAGEEAAKQELTNFGLLFDVSEESDFSGIKEAINLVNPEIVIVGEPTDFKLVRGQKGLIGIKVQCYGKSASGSTPEKGVSAIDKLIEILPKIKAIPWWPEDEILGKTTINIGQICGGTAPNVVADYAEAKIEIRTTKSSKEIRALIEKEIPKENLIIEYDYEFVFTDTKFNFDFEQIVVPYFTEMYFWAQKAKTFVFGPGKYEFAHSDDEKISKKDLEKGKAAYLEIIRKLVEVKDGN